ncbi:response regulator transcription factor [Chitinophaga deserti]|uniref:response regulator transcription factor n=1 Tax=Chitinophaga deserti TaxID=2164099 RepID=UPI000D6D5EC3|nr:response regulator transcription factor [Chitinophaga deserti]
MLKQTAEYSIAIVDDHPVVIEGLRTLLQGVPGISSMHAFTTGGEFMDWLEHHTADIVLLDIMLPDVNGLDLCKDIKLAAPETIVLAVSNQAERSMILQILQNGASGYLLKNASAAEFRRCLEEALSGGVAFSREVREILARPGRAELKAPAALTRREKQILQLVTEGKTTTGIAKELHLSPLTVETHRRNMMQKLEVKNAAELIMAAVQRKLL